MKLLVLISALLLFFNYALAADFRTLNFGDPCSDVKTEEYLLGNSPNTEQNDQDSHYEFNGVFLDRATTIIYYCGKDNSFHRGLYVFKFTSEQDLKNFFGLAKSHLKYLFGPPTFDGSKLSSQNINSIFRYDLQWDKEQTSISVKVVGNFNGPNSKKRMQIWYRSVE